MVSYVHIEYFTYKFSGEGGGGIYVTEKSVVIAKGSRKNVIFF